MTAQSHTFLASVQIRQQKYSDCAHDTNVYGGVMPAEEAIQVVESVNQPVAAICPSWHCLDGC